MPRPRWFAEGPRPRLREDARVGPRVVEGDGAEVGAESSVRPRELPLPLPLELVWPDPLVGGVDGTELALD